MIENYSDMVRESPHNDFEIIFNAILCKMIRRIQFSTYFWPPGKIDGIMAVFSLKKVDIIENNMNGGMVREFRLMIFWLFSMLLHVKWSIETDFPFTFDHLTKLTGIVANYVNFFYKKTAIIPVNFVRRSKVNGKSDSMDHFT